jgi:AraC-like DNA-binding protein
MLGAKGDERELVLGRGVRAAMQSEILRGIKRRATDHGISAETISRELGITSRYVHKLLEETGRTFSEHVLEERLTLAFAMLTEPSTARRKITDVAATTGFSDISYFNRTFRRRFGDTPSAVRARFRI